MFEQLTAKGDLSAPKPHIKESSKVWAKIDILSFGGPAGQIALMHKTLVEERKWLSEKQFLNALNFCMLLPGPEAMQLAGDKCACCRLGDDPRSGAADHKSW